MIEDLLRSKAGQDLLHKGKLPPVEVSVETASIVTLCTGILITVVIILLSKKIIGKL